MAASSTRRAQLDAALRAVMGPFREGTGLRAWAALENASGEELARWSEPGFEAAAPAGGRFALPALRGTSADLRLVLGAERPLAELAPWGRWAAELCAQLLEREQELEDLAAALGRCFEERSFLADFAAELSAARDEAELGAGLVRRGAELVRAERAFLALRSAGAEEGYTIIASRGFAVPPRERHGLGEGLTGAVLREGAPCCVPDALAFPPEGLADFEETAHRNLLLVPLHARGECAALGVLGVLDAGGAQGLGGEEERLLLHLAEHVAAVLAALRRREAEGEARLVRSARERLVLAPYGSRGDLSFGSAQRPAPHGGAELAERVDLGGGAAALYLLSTSARGVLAPVRLAAARAILRAALGRTRDPALALAELAHELGAELERSEELLGVSLASFEPDGALRWASAGHPAPLLRLANGSVSTLAGETAALLGLRRGEHPLGGSGRIEPGAALVLCSAGAVAARAARGGVCGEALLRSALASCDMRCAEALALALLEALERAPLGACAHDLTVLVARRAAPEVETTPCRARAAEELLA